jgi:Fe-S-cluster containining protein
VSDECTACGACCLSESDRHARVTGDDYERLGEDAERLVVWIGNQAYMRIVRTGSVGHCAALSVPGAHSRSFACTIYERRPAVCRELERGSPACDAELFLKGERSAALVELGRRRVVTRPA